MAQKDHVIIKAFIVGNQFIPYLRCLDETAGFIEDAMKAAMDEVLAECRLR